MQVKHVHYSRLSGPDAIAARVAAAARWDTISGGTGAASLVCELRPEAGEHDLRGIVSAVYRASSGKPSREFEAWECPECGSAHLGMERALSCCANTDEDEFTPNGLED